MLNLRLSRFDPEQINGTPGKAVGCPAFVGGATKACLVAGGWLHPSQRENREAVKLALSAICGRVLASGVANSDLPIVEADPKALQVAAAWVKPGTQLSMQAVGRALSTAILCSQIVGFGPQEFTSRARQMADLG